MVEQCSNCRFWLVRSDRPSGLSGYCRRYPPAFPSGLTVVRGVDWVELRPSSDFANDAWPYTGHNSWCGEYSRALEAKEGKADG